VLKYERYKKLMNEYSLYKYALLIYVNMAGVQELRATLHRSESFSYLHLAGSDSLKP